MARTPSLLLLLLALTWMGCASGDEPSDTAGTEAAVSPTASSPADDEAAIRALEDSWDPAYLSGDPARVAALYTEDAVRLSADKAIERGHDEILEGFAASFADQAPVTSSNPTNAVGVAGDWAWSYGTFTGSGKSNDSGEIVEDTGKWLSILRRTDDGWAFEADAWNSDLPFTGEAEALSGHELPPAEGIADGPAADLEAIRANLATWEEATVASDADLQTSRYADDAIRMNDRGTTDVGAEAIRAVWASDTATYSEADANLDVIEVDGDWAWVRGHWGVTGNGPDGSAFHDMGKWISVLRRTGDGWKIQVEIWNRDQPFPAPEATG